jgi:hypothetical protein
MPVTRRNRKNSRKNERKNRSSRRNGGFANMERRNSRKNQRRNSRRNSRVVMAGGYRMYKFWPRNRAIAFVNALHKKGLIANPGSVVSEERALEILAEVEGVSVDELKNNVNPILFGKVRLGLSENELERGLLKSDGGFVNHMDDMKKELRWANEEAFSEINFPNVPSMKPLNHRD